MKKESRGDDGVVNSLKQKLKGCARYGAPYGVAESAELLAGLRE